MKGKRQGGKRNAVETREKILQAAIGEFAAHGYSGARVERIRARARVNTRMLYHYFGDKRRLYVAVLEHVIGGYAREAQGVDGFVRAARRGDYVIVPQPDGDGSEIVLVRANRRHRLCRRAD